MALASTRGSLATEPLPRLLRNLRAPPDRTGVSCSRDLSGLTNHSLSLTRSSLVRVSPRLTRTDRTHCLRSFLVSSVHVFQEAYSIEVLGTAEGAIEGASVHHFFRRNCFHRRARISLSLLLDFQMLFALLLVFPELAQLDHLSTLASKVFGGRTWF